MNALWYINVGCAAVLECLLFWRGFHRRLFSRYPVLFTYLAYTSVRSIVVSLPNVIASNSFAKIYWWSHIAAALIRFGIVAELQSQIFPSKSPIRSRSQITIAAALVMVAICFWVMGAGPGHYMFDALRKIAFALAVWIVVVVGVARYHGIGIGRNIWGVAAGFLIFIGSELIHLSAIDLVPQLWAVWRYVHPVAWVLMLAIWTFALWNYHPNPELASVEISRTGDLQSAWEQHWIQVGHIPGRLMKPWAN